jgi:hypothetical protein
MRDYVDVPRRDPQLVHEAAPAVLAVSDDCIDPLVELPLRGAAGSRAFAREHVVSGQDERAAARQ